MVDKHSSDRNQLAKETKQERRERRRAKEKARMLQHGKGLARVYRDAVSRRAKTEKPDKRSS